MDPTTDRRILGSGIGDLLFPLLVIDAFEQKTSLFLPNRDKTLCGLANGHTTGREKPKLNCHFIQKMLNYYEEIQKPAINLLHQPRIL